MMEETDWLRLREAGEAYAVDVSQVLGDYGTERLQLNPTPNGALGWLLGIGGDVPVLNLPGTARRRPVTSRIVLLAASRTVGVGIDIVEGTEVRPSADLHWLPRAIGGGFFKAAAVLGGEVVLLLEPEGAAQAAAASDYRTAQETGVTAPFPVLSMAPEAPSPEPDAPSRLLVFTACGGKVLVGFPAHQVVEIVRPTKIRSVPGAPSSTLGLIIWKDQPVPILDVELATSATSTPAPTGRLLIARAPSSGALAAIPVEKVGAILQGPLRGKVVRLPAEESATWVRQAYVADGRKVALPNLDVALDPREA
jgi:hypothetical protein